jgi:hypothetical protein
MWSIEGPGGVVLGGDDLDLDGPLAGPLRVWMDLNDHIALTPTGPEVPVPPRTEAESYHVARAWYRDIHRGRVKAATPPPDADRVIPPVEPGRIY